MTYRWNARGDAVSTSVLWIGSLVAALVCVAWLANNLAPDHISLQQIDNELTEMQKQMNKACRMTYWRNYFPKVNAGNLIINDMQVCIDSSPCIVVYYSGTAEETLAYDIQLSNIGKCENILECNPYYYTGEAYPIFEDTRILLLNATRCENEKAPIVRCRLLTCYLNSTQYIGLEELLYLNITRDRNGILTIEAH